MNLNIKKQQVNLKSTSFRFNLLILAFSGGGGFGVETVSNNMFSCVKNGTFRTIPKELAKNNATARSFNKGIEC